MIVKYDTEMQFEVKGAGNITVGRNAHSACGGAVGFHFAVSWVQGGRGGGVLGRAEAIKLANYILEKTKDISEPEHVEYERRFPPLL